MWGLKGMAEKLDAAKDKLQRTVTAIADGKEEVDPDPGHIIEEWVHPIPLPTWNDKGAYKECYKCHDMFMPGHKHNCRLCGHLFCSHCTQKHHIPDEYKVKGKPGPSRVCYTCRDICMDNMKLGDPITWDSLQDKQLVSSTNPQGKLVIHPPKAWTKEAEECRKCLTLFHKDHKYNCRVCGHMYCDGCTSKMEVPAAYERKNKQGKARVCDSCRHLVLKKVELSPLPPLFHNEEKATYVPPVITVEWAGPDHAFVCELQDKTRKKSLSQLYDMLIKEKPKLADKAFYFLCKGKPVFQEHWDFFKFKHVAPKLVLRVGYPEDDVAIKPVKEKNPFSKGELAVCAHSYTKPGDATHLQLSVGDIISVTRKPNDNWWYGQSQKGAGWFPARFVKLQDDSFDTQPGSNSLDNPRRSAAQEEMRQIIAQATRADSTVDVTLIRKATLARESALPQEKSEYADELDELDAELAAAAKKK